MARSTRVGAEGVERPELFPLGVCEPGSMVAAISLGNRQVEIFTVGPGATVYRTQIGHS